MSSSAHPGETALDLYRQLVHQSTQAKAKRCEAAELRKAAKAAALKVDAYALRKKAKPLSDEAQGHSAAAKQLLKELIASATEAHRLLTARMPPEWRDWGVVKTRAYANLLQILTAQTASQHPKPPVVANALRYLLSHASWSDKTLQALGTVKPDAKRLIEE